MKLQNLETLQSSGRFIAATSFSPPTRSFGGRIQKFRPYPKKFLWQERFGFSKKHRQCRTRFWFDAQPQRGAEAGIFSGEFTGYNFFWLDKIYNQYRRWGREMGGSALEIHVYGPPETLAQPDAMLLTQVMPEVPNVWPELRGHRLGQHLQRNAETHTLPAVGSADRHFGTLTSWPGLFCAGVWVRHKNRRRFSWSALS